MFTVYVAYAHAELTNSQILIYFGKSVMATRNALFVCVCVCEIVCMEYQRLIFLCVFC